MENEQTEKKYSKLQWFFYVIFIPLIFAITLSLIILTVAGLNVFTLAKGLGENIPFVSGFINGEEEDKEQDIYSIKAELEEQKVIVAEYQTDIENKDAKISALEDEIESLESEIDRIEQENSEEAQQENKPAEIASMYEEMSTKSAAAILSEIEQEEVIDILLELSMETRAAILEKMPTATAANLTVELKQRSEQ